MADKDSAPTFNPKHRILGAVIVVSLAVIFVPLILDRQEPPSELKNPSASRDQKPGETRVVVTPVAELGTASNKPAVQPAPPPAASAKPVADPLPLPAKPDPAPEPVSPPAPAKPAAAAIEKKKEASKEEPAKATRKDPIKKGWAVQVGVYSSTENAERMVARLKKIGVKPRTETITISGSKAKRLRVGPYRDRASAEREQARIQKGIGEKVVVVAWP